MDEKERRIEELKNEAVLTYCCGESPLLVQLLPLVAFAAFLLVVVLIKRGKGRDVGFALVLTALFPVFVALCAAIDGLIDSGRVIEQSGTEPEVAALAGSIAYTATNLRYGLLLALPALLTAAVGSVVRALKTPRP